eukprot:CAMPEP_0171085904 /NCGR_PEP_ID=MMETSP0766_2-20121228/19219_1 /TAXON_ID=439317 /ORGANISM="Gambierdiscus australes, Strain CAWD 149" /LENGTH=48 /DNA_ID= /DNA_START= /DNA_END= /DNA_ORIENTATION=
MSLSKAAFHEPKMPRTAVHQLAFTTSRPTAATYNAPTAANATQVATFP